MTPRATYRLQLHPGFGLREAGEVAAYVAELGASHLYLSPVAQAAPDSGHGYDAADPTRISDDLGGPLAWAALLEETGRCSLGIVLDIVPNHMSVATALNRWWWDVLRFGPASPFAAFFDIEWDLPQAEGRVLLPVLAAPLAEALERGEVRLEQVAGQLRAVYFDHTAPLGPAAAGEILRDAGGSFAELAAQQERLAEADRVSAEQRDAADAALQAACADAHLAAALDGALRRAQRPERLGALLDQQAWRFIDWREPARNYRRFFEIDDLVGVRVEREEVFEAVHALPLSAVETGAADGLRIDHPDGLRDPVGYVRRLRRRAPEAWIVLEKILEPGEQPRDWPIDGLTGYDFLATVTGVLTDPAGADPLQEVWAALCGEAPGWRDLAGACKRYAAEQMLAPEVDRAARALAGGGAAPDGALREAVIEVGCALPVYRTYLRPGLDTDEAPSPEDMRLVLQACAEARRRRPDLGAGIDRVQRAMLGDAGGAAGELSHEPAAAEFTLRFQQLTGVLMAKGVEDTAFYRSLRLVALNEVGGDPGRFGLSLDAFHRQMHTRQERWPRAMLATSTHDTKRSEDVRARLFVLAELPEAWREATQRWQSMAAELQRAGEMERIHPGDAYLLYQTLVGAWPIEQPRVAGFMQKALREAKLRSSWTEPDEEYEAAVERFLDCLYSEGDLLADIAAFAGRITGPGQTNALSQALLKFTCPGTPDIYQGCELWDLSLVDPDNRRPVDFALRRRLLEELDRIEPVDIWRRMDEGLPKLWLTRQALDLRARRPELFDSTAQYTAMAAVGPQADCCIAFMRGEGAIAIATRFPARLEGAGGWGETTFELPAGDWRDVLSGQRWAQGNHPLDELLRMAPVALLEREGGV